MSSSKESAPRAPAARRSRPGRETNPRKELVRDQLIDVAARVFDEKGYDRFSMADIANAVGLGRSAIYHYFSSKDEILAAIVEAEALTPSHHLKTLSAESGLSATEWLRRAIVDGIVRRLSSGSRFVTLSRLEDQIPGDLRTVYNHSRREIYDYYVHCIEHGIATGEFRSVDPKIAAFSVLGMANWTSRWYSPSGRNTPQEIAVTIADLALASLRAPSARERGIDEARGKLDQVSAEIEDLRRLLG
ncbi:MAG: TetR family transcriptional regulator [Devosia sp.]|nr:TetR family transcriptional regulator [Devosia sp.]